NRLTAWSHAGTNPRRLDFHQRDETVDFRLGGRQLGENAAEAERVLAQRGPHPLVTCRRRVSLVEDEIDDLEHRLESLSELGAARDLERHARRRERALGPDDPLLNRRLR